MVARITRSGVPFDHPEREEAELQHAAGRVACARPADEEFRRNPGGTHMASTTTGRTTSPRALRWRPLSLAIAAITAIGVPLARAADAAEPTAPVIGDASVEEGDSGQVTLTMPITWYGDTDCSWTFTIDHGTTDDDDIVFPESFPFTNTVDGFASGVAVEVGGDTLDEDDETITVELAGVGADPCVFADASAIGTILDDDEPAVAAPALTFGSISASEGDAGATSFTFTVTTPDVVPPGYQCTMSLAVGHGTTDDTDFAGGALPATVTAVFTASGQTYGVSVQGDTAIEADEQFVLTATGSGVNPCTLTSPTANATIVNDDVPPPPDDVRVTVRGAQVVEGNSGWKKLCFTVALAEASHEPVTVRLLTSGGTATAGVDYQRLDRTVTIQPGRITATVCVQVKGDRKVERDETVLVSVISDQRGVVIDTPVAVGTICNDDRKA